MDSFDTSWFNLEKYSGLEKLDLVGWRNQIIHRQCLEEALHYDQVDDGAFWGHIVAKIKSSPVIEESLAGIKLEDEAGSLGGLEKPEISSGYPFNTVSVKSTSVSAMLFNQSINKDIVNEGISNEEMNMPYDVFLSNRDHLVDKANVTIDIFATDEQIKQDFNHWLKFHRKKWNLENKKLAFSQENFTKWIKWRLIPYLDLKLISIYENKELSLVDIAGLLYSHEYSVDIVERVRRTTKVQAERLINGQTDLAMQAQLLSKGR